jgi:hypothetical protein
VRQQRQPRSCGVHAPRISSDVPRANQPTPKNSRWEGKLATG